MSTESSKLQSRPQGVKDKTTPRPWRLERDGDGDFCIVTDKSSLHGGGLVIAVMDCENADEPVNIADGELIVKAVNEREKLRSAHDDLYVACCTAYDLLQNMSSDTFAHGGDRAIKDRLAEAIDRAELNGFTPRKERES